MNILMNNIVEATRANKRIVGLPDSFAHRIVGFQSSKNFWLHDGSDASGVLRFNGSYQDDRATIWWRTRCNGELSPQLITICFPVFSIWHRDEASEPTAHDDVELTTKLASFLDRPNFLFRVVQNERSKEYHDERNRIHGRIDFYLEVEIERTSS